MGKSACLLALVLIGCAAKKPERKAVSTIYVPRECLQGVELTPKSYCESPDTEHLVCYKLKLSKLEGCEQIKVKE